MRDKRTAPLDFSLLLATPKPQSGANKESEAMAKKEQSPFQPDDVLAGAELKELEGIKGTFTWSGHAFYHRGSG